MRRVWGLILFCLGTGMACMLILPNKPWVMLVMAAMIIGGYQLFCGC